VAAGTSRPLASHGRQRKLLGKATVHLARRGRRRLSVCVLCRVSLSLCLCPSALSFVACSNLARAATDGTRPLVLQASRRECAHRPGRTPVQRTLSRRCDRPDDPNLHTPGESMCLSPLRCICAGFRCGAATTDPTACGPGTFCPIGSASADNCPAGTYSSRTEATSSADCTPTPLGHASRAGATAPEQCGPGSFADHEASVSCTPCDAGAYQDVWAATACMPCPSGSYCEQGASHPVPCSAGRFSDSPSLTSDAECDVCPIGHACSLGSLEPLPCAAGRFGASHGQTSRECTGACIEGHYCIEGSTTNISGICRERRPNASSTSVSVTNTAFRLCALSLISLSPRCHAAAGRFNPVIGGTSDAACAECKVGQSSPRGSASCTICDGGFYRPQATSAASECTACDSVQGISCGLDTTTATLNLTRGYWRHSAATIETHYCKSDGSWSPCLGGGDAGHEGDGYCAPGYRGPRCELCGGPASTQYFDSHVARCKPCGDVVARGFAAAGLVVGVLAAVGGPAIILQRPPTTLSRKRLVKQLHKLRALWRAAGMQCKIKIGCALLTTQLTFNLQHNRHTATGSLSLSAS
jgi:hypothetical protein